MKCAAFYLLVGLLISSFACGAVFAQATAQINGSVKDATGAVLPGVQVTATQTDTGITRSTFSDETGSYILPNLSVGPYRLEVALPGFRTYVQTGVVLQVNDKPSIAITLQVGEVSEQVEVQANAAMVETRNVGISQVVENARILELPLNGRQVTDLVLLSGASVQDGTVRSDYKMSGSAAVGVAGGLGTATVYLLDGSFHNDPLNNFNLPLPFPDALQEFKMETSALSAQNGIYSGATVSAVTKSGTNQFHGDLFEFVRNDLFNARPYFALRSSTLKRNQFGGTLGGPILRNKLFFFGGYQGTIVRQDAADQIAFVPNAAMLSGDFTAFTAPACNAGRQINLNAPFVNNRINSSLLSKAALNIAEHLPQTSDPCGVTHFGIRTVTNEHQTLGRIDYQQSSNHSLFGRYLATKFDQPIPYSLDANWLNTTTQGFDNLSQAFSFGDTYLRGPNQVNSFRLALSRTALNHQEPDLFSASDEGVNAYSYYKHMVLTVNGAFKAGQFLGPWRTTTYEASDEFNIIHGRHQVSVGGELAYWRINTYASTFGEGYYTFTGQAIGSGLADFLTGKLGQLQQSKPNETHMSQWSIGAYVTDAWRIRPKLTLNYGIRWEPGLPQVRRNGVVANFSEDDYKAGIKTTVFKNAPFGFKYPGDPGFPGTSCRASGICNATGRFSQWGLVAPRLGFAWDPKADGRMSIRASYGMAYDLVTGVYFLTYISPPWQNQLLVVFPSGGLDNPWSDYPGGNPFPTPPLNPNSPFVPYGNYFVVNRDNPASGRQLWNLSLQKQIGTDWLVSANYMGSQASHLWFARELNPAIYIPGTCSAGQYGLTAPGACSTSANRDFRRRLALQYPNIVGTPMAFLDQYEGQGTQSYNGLQVTVQRRAANGVTVGGNYTWSHCIGNTTSMSSGGTPGSTSQDSNNRSLDRGNCALNRSHIFNMTALAETPRFANSTLRTLATGWRLSGIYRVSSGAWLTITSGQDRQLSGLQNQRPNQTLGSPYGNKSLGNYLNPAAFALPPAGTLGNMRPGNVQGPGRWQLDMALSRIFRLRENHTLEVRAEAFDVTNRLQPGNPQTNLTAPNFGQIISAAAISSSQFADPRIMEFALKYLF